MMEELNIDCYGKCYFPVISLQCGEKKVHFVFDEKRKVGVRFHMALVVDYQSLTRKYLRYPWSRRACLLAEPRASHHFRKDQRLSQRFRNVFTHDRVLLESGDDRYVPLLYGTSWISWDEKRLAERKFAKTKLLSFVGGLHPGAEGGHGLRNVIAENLLADGRADCYGKGIQYIASKLAGLADYAFSVAMENHQQDYYFTEKINDCFLAETVPIYWGCPGITRFFDPRGMFIFNTVEEFVQIVDELSMDMYLMMKPFVLENKRKAIENRWHSLQGYYERIAEEIITRYDLTSTVFLRPALVKCVGRFKRSLRM